MKAILKALAKYQTNTCTIFAGSIIIYAIVNFICGESSVSMNVLVSMFIISVVGGIWQFVAFSHYVVKGMRYSFRLILFAVPFFALLSACAFIFKWFPVEYMVSWIIFAVIFLLVFIALTLIFELYYKSAGKKYDDLLGQYKKNTGGKR